MKLEDLAYLASRLFAVYFVYFAVVQAIYLINPDPAMEAMDTAEIKLDIAFTLLSALVFWSGAGSVARILCGRRASGTREPKISYSEIQFLCVTTIALGFVVYGFGALSAMTILLLSPSYYGTWSESMRMTLQMPQFTIPLCLLVLGFLMLIFSGGIARTMTRLRNWHTSPIQKTDSQISE